MGVETGTRNVPLDQPTRPNDNTGNPPNNNVTNEAIPRAGEGNLPTASRPDTGTPHLPGVDLVSNQVQIDKTPDGKPTAYHSNGFSFEYHESDKHWYYHQDSGGKYVKIEEPHLNDDGTVTAYESNGWRREHKLQASGQTTESISHTAKRDWDNGLQGATDILSDTSLSHMFGDFKRGTEKAWHDLKDGNVLGAIGDVVKRDVNVIDDFLTFASGKNPTRAWTMGQQLEADLATGNPDQFKRDLDTLNALWDGKSYGGTTRGDERFYDDNNWIGIALVDAYKQNPEANQAYLDQAKKIFDYVKTGEEGTDKLQPPGGIFWQQGQPYRAAVSTAGAEQLALSLYQQTGDKQYLDFAVRQHEWMDHTLKADNGLYNDGIGPDGKLTKDQWSYNQGLMLGNATMLYQATGDKKYLDQAQEIAKNSLQAFGKDGSERDFTEQNVFFNAVFFKNLMQLDAVAPDNSYRQALAKYNYDMKGILSSGINTGVYENMILTRASARQVSALAEQYPPA